MRHLMEAAGRIAGLPELIRFGAVAPRPWDPEFIYTDTRKLRGLGWAPGIPLEAGLQKMIEAPWPM
jgi:nucleoside-diphosphate-sugar epimerase